MFRWLFEFSQHPSGVRGVGKERGSHEGENLRDRVRGGKSLTLVPLVVSLVNIAATLLNGIANPRSAIRQKALSVAYYRSTKLNDITEVHQAKDFFCNPKRYTENVPLF